MAKYGRATKPSCCEGTKGEVEAHESTSPREKSGQSRSAERHESKLCAHRLWLHGKLQNRLSIHLPAIRSTHGKRMPFHHCPDVTTVLMSTPSSLILGVLKSVRCAHVKASCAVLCTQPADADFTCCRSFEYCTTHVLPRTVRVRKQIQAVPRSLSTQCSMR